MSFVIHAYIKSTGEKIYIRRDKSTFPEWSFVLKGDTVEREYANVIRKKRDASVFDDFVEVIEIINTLNSHIGSWIKNPGWERAGNVEEFLTREVVPDVMIDDLIQSLHMLLDGQHHSDVEERFGLDSSDTEFVMKIKTLTSHLWRP